MPAVLLAPSNHGHRSPARPAGKTSERWRRRLQRARRETNERGRRRKDVRRRRVEKHGSKKNVPVKSERGAAVGQEAAARHRRSKMHWHRLFSDQGFFFLLFFFRFIFFFLPSSSSFVKPNNAHHHARTQLRRYCCAHFFFTHSRRARNTRRVRHVNLYARACVCVSTRRVFTRCRLPLCDPRPI